ncbi:MAG: ATP-binding cassette domain-containing protein [Desulfomonilaceae bacterium]|nr:ATP-binding cassette domain-containing protein [Desulfomonilaceae bacterium]
MIDGNARGTISITGLGKNFGNLTALKDIHLEIGKGELFGLLGPNGAGKTTLISILSTILSPSAGTASVGGHDVQREANAVRRAIGIVFQDPSLDVELTGQENLDFHGRLYGMRGSLRKSRIDEVLSLVDLSIRRNDPVKTYSGGMRRRLEIARGLMHRPEVLFLDEPTLGLDPQTRRKIWHYIRSLEESFGMTIILTTHYMDEADRLCSRVAIIDRGEIVALDSPQNLKTRLGGDVLDVDIAEASPEFIEKLKIIGDLRSVKVQDGRLMITVERGESFVPRLFETAQTMGVAISAVSMRKPNLEDVFIQLTGREIREEAPVEPKDRIGIYRWGRRT